MLKLFGGKSDHPLADPREAKRVIEALSTDDPAKSLDELMHWLESVTAAEGFKPEARVQLLFSLDEAAQPRVRKLAADYFGAVRPSRFQENRLWTALHGYYQQAGLSYARAVDLYVQNAKGVEAAKALLPVLLARTLRSLAQQVKWMHLRYGPVDFRTWAVMNGVYAFSELRQLAGTAVPLYPGQPGTSSPQEEYLRALVFGISAPDALLPREAEIAERLIAVYAPKFRLAPAAAPELPFWTDLGQAMAPARQTRAAKPGIGLRHFGVDSALAEIHAHAEAVLTTGAVPPEVNLRGSFESPAVLEVMRHLHTYWAPQPPERQAPRHPVKSWLSVAYGYEGVMRVLGGSDSLDFDAQGTEVWVAENVSTGGFGAVVPAVKGDWLRVGTLLALQPKGGTNWVLGVVRRMNRVDSQQARVGIETLSRTPAVEHFAVSGVRGMASPGIVVRGADAAEAKLVLKPGVFAPAQNLEVERGGRQHVFIPQAIAEKGEDYEIARYRELVRES